ncbi:MAG: ABC transporter substrate-binding protein [Sporichthyaceae bacterium]
MNVSRLRARRSAIALGTLSAVLLVSGCGGTRIDHERIVAAGNGGGGAGLVPSAAQFPADAAAAEAAVEAPAAAGEVPAADTTAAVDAPAAAATAKVPAAKEGAAKPAAGAAKNAPAASTTTTAAAPKAAAAACPQQLAPIVLGQTLAASGLVGAAIAGLRTGVAVWARDVNARGGIACRSIQVVQLDDGSDPSRVSANWNQLMKVKGAIACLGCGAPIPIAALRTAAERDKIPIIGGDNTAVDWFESQWLFPSGGAPLASYSGAYIDAAKVAPGAKAGIMYCVEASVCTSLKNNHPEGVKRAGMELGPVKAVSLTQPDFTAECQSMKDSGVKVVFLGLDGSASTRVARSCISLGYKPVIVTGAIAVSQQAAVDTNLRSLGVYLGTGTAPFTEVTAPPVAAYLAAMARYAPGAAVEQQAMLGWAAGKLFEAAMAKVVDKAKAGTVNTALVLDGLWQLKDEKLGGLSPGATFTKGSPAKYVDCYYGLALGPKGFTSPTGAKPVCYQGKGAAAGSVQPVGAELPAAFVGSQSVVASGRRAKRR